MRPSRQRVADVRKSLDARAAGLWRVEGDRLVQVAFVASEEMAREAAEGFADATREARFDQTTLGIVKAAVNRTVTVSIADELPSDSGSGYWLRAFGACRSVAVPLLDPEGNVLGVFSVALAAETPSAHAVAEIVRASAAAP
jgi:hypothetical protein